MQIRKYNQSDFPAIKNLLRENQKYHATIDPLGLRKFSEQDVAEDITKFTERMDTGEGYCLVVEDNN